MPRFVIKGHIKPYVRMTQRGKWCDPQAHEYLSSKAGIGLQVKAQMARAGLEMLPPKTPLAVMIIFRCANGMHRADLDNLGKAVIDAMQGIVFKNDCWIDHIELDRVPGSEDTTVVVVGELTGAWGDARKLGVDNAPEM